jgi:predicted enzyme related to lactoylglutathione lyase
VGGDVIFMEFPSEDIERAQRFWSGVLGWQFGSGLFDGYDYRMAQVSTGLGVAITPGDLGQGYPNVYLETSDLDAALTRVRELGGEVVEEVREVPERIATELPSSDLHGRFAKCKDSEGNTFCLMERQE